MRIYWLMKKKEGALLVGVYVRTDVSRYRAVGYPDSETIGVQVYWTDIARVVLCAVPTPDGTTLY